jgi:hypothetical protein
MMEDERSRLEAMMIMIKKALQTIEKPYIILLSFYCSSG